MIRSYEKIMADLLRFEAYAEGLDLDALAREMYRRGRQDGYDEGYRDGVDVTVRDADRQLK